MNIKHVFIILTIIGLLAGCTAHNTVERNANGSVIGYDPMEVKLAEAGASISHSLNSLASAQKINRYHSQAYRTLPDISFDQMPGTAAVDWAGPIEPLLRKIAHHCGYTLRVLGRRPAIPVLISISTRHAIPIGYIVRDAAYQAVNKARVVVYPRLSIIELRYFSP